MPNHSMRYVFRADVHGLKNVWDGIWFETDKYTKESAERLFICLKDGKYRYNDEIYDDVTYLGIFRDDNMPQTDSECLQALINLEHEQQQEPEEGINVYDAALIWMSNGKDEDYMFGYTTDELENAL